MSSDLQLIKRALAAIPASNLPADVARFFEDGLTRFLHTPGITMEDAFGLQRAIGKRGIWAAYGQQARAELLQTFFIQNYLRHDVSKYQASAWLAHDLDVLQAGAATGFPPEYVRLFESLRLLPVAVPTLKSEVYRNLRVRLKGLL